MKRISLLLALCLSLLFAGGVLSQWSSPSIAQTDGTPTATHTPVFEIVGEIGRALPRKMVYDPQRERMAIVDAYSRLLLVNAPDYSTIAVLHERGQYGDLAFSRDGRWLAVTFGLTMELWDTESATLAARLDNLGGVQQLFGPLAFSSDDQVLIFYGVYPAPRALRLTENDTIVYPWVWHLPAAREDGESTLPGGVEAIQMFDYANGFVLSPDDTIIAALPGRLRVLNAFTLATEYEIPTDRYEQDPLIIWNSLGDQSVYVRPVSANTLLQVDTDRRALVEIPMDVRLTEEDRDLLGGLELGESARVIGPQASRRNIPLLRTFLGYYYRDSTTGYGERPLTVTLVDLLLPPAASQDNVRALLYVYEEDTDLGYFQFSNSGQFSQMAIHPNGDQVLIRLQDGDEYVVTYDLESGEELDRFLPALRAIGGYQRRNQNRILAYDQSGEVIISDFQRIEADTNEVIAEDLRYSRQFERFYFSENNTSVVTLSGSEWREWDIASGQIIRREVIRIDGEIIATSDDGHRFLSQYYTYDGAGASVLDLRENINYTVRFDGLPGSSVEEVFANPSWTQFLVVYGVNSYGQHAPGNQIALYHYEDGLQWLIAGDDLPPMGGRQYGWVDEETVFVYGQGFDETQPRRVYGVDYAENSLPQCIMDRYPEHEARFSQLWERMVYYLRADHLNEWTLLICEDLPESADEVEDLFRPTDTPVFIEPTGVAIGEVPTCLTAQFAGEAQAYADVWNDITANASPQDRARLADLLCEGIGVVQPSDEFDPLLGVTMFINAETGERASGAFTRPVVIRRPLDRVYQLFREIERRELGTAILSPNAEFVAASSLPGELVIYRLIEPYDSIMAVVTQTAVAQLSRANLIRAEPSSSPTYNMIGTPRPTLTPTIALTLYPRADQPAFRSVRVQPICPAETLYSIDNPPASYDATGRLYAAFDSGPLWVIEPETGQRAPDESIIQCGRGIDCQFSPDNRWVLAEDFDLIYVIRPDSSDQRVLWDKRTPNPPTPFPFNLYWSGNQALEWQAPLEVTDVYGYVYYPDAYVRDVINVFPDPSPWIPEFSINGLPTSFVSRQPGGLWAVAYTTYNTGLGIGYKYYLYHTERHEYQLFAQLPFGGVDFTWHPDGGRLFYQMPHPRLSSRTEVYQVVFPDVTNQYLPEFENGTWSNDGRYRAFSMNSRSQPIGVWDSVTGETRTYCLPETGARLYQGPFTWSPDNRYLALLAPLPKDETVEGVGSHTLILNLETGEVVDLTTGSIQHLVWAQEPGTYGDGRVTTPTPTPSVTP